MSQHKQIPHHALILAAGTGSRLRPLTQIIPKCLCPIKNKPLLGHWIEKFVSLGSESIFINTHYQANQIKKYISEQSWHEQVNLLHEEDLSGTGGTLCEVLNKIKHNPKPLIVIHADNFSDIDLSHLLNSHQLFNTHQQKRRNLLATIALFISKEPEHCGIVSCDEQNIIRSFVEKPKAPASNLANAAIYVMEPDILEQLKIPRTQLKDISLDLIPLLVNHSQGYMHLGTHIDIGRISSYADALLID